ncbi:hypothetical protein BDK51DRAFT_36610 [Blyttiomyces helicus]|uniref:Uncharacterized protein n=1 Tax=Blyttiomyces helicus TaxID=388810 RepID=A0A4P9W7F5_9FUNG|nr:hypothetical protein BDK51DRAFT_36610 [Blyttiomyces helicus]|eukprot:RKO88294.1 hypothetical protein BDK51DRAFT_36610 [Blyttiomyces helicus]
MNTERRPPHLNLHLLPLLLLLLLLVHPSQPQAIPSASWNSPLSTYCGETSQSCLALQAEAAKVQFPSVALGKGDTVVVFMRVVWNNNAQSINFTGSVATTQRLVYSAAFFPVVDSYSVMTIPGSWTNLSAHVDDNVPLTVTMTLLHDNQLYTMPEVPWVQRIGGNINYAPFRTVVGTLNQDCTLSTCSCIQSSPDLGFDHICGQQCTDPAALYGNGTSSTCDIQAMTSGGSRMRYSHRTIERLAAAAALMDGSQVSSVQFMEEETTSRPQSASLDIDAKPDAEPADSNAAPSDAPAADTTAAEPTDAPTESAPAPESGPVAENETTAAPAPIADAIPVEPVAPPADTPAVAPVEAVPEDVDGPVYKFLKRNDEYKRPSIHLPEASEIALAKSYLMTSSQRADLSLYDHLTSVVVRILETRPANALDIFETISGDIKRSKFNVEDTHAPGALRKAPDVSPSNDLAKLQIKFFQV